MYKCSRGHELQKLATLGDLAPDLPTTCARSRRAPAAEIENFPKQPRPASVAASRGTSPDSSSPSLTPLGGARPRSSAARAHAPPSP